MAAKLPESAESTGMIIRIGTNFEVVQYVSTALSHRSKHIKNSSVGYFSWPPQRFDYFREFAAVQKHRHGVTAGVLQNYFANFNGVVRQIVVKDHLARISKHVFTVVPEAVEPEDMSVMVHELLQRVGFLVGSEWLLTFILLYVTYIYMI